MRAAIRLAAPFIVIIVLIAASTAPVSAQQVPERLPDEEAAEVVEPIRKYSVELIIFTYSENVSAGNEIWLPDEPAVDGGDDSPGDTYYGDLDQELTGIEAPAIGRRYMDLELALFDRDDYTMNRIYDKLVELDAYEPVIRAGWTQPTYEKDVTASIPLDTLAKAPPWLGGRLTLYRGRYLHLVVDLTMDEDRSANDAEASTPGVRTFSDTPEQYRHGEIDAYGELVAPRIRYRISEDRIMKNGDIRYFDHPKFGVIAKITRHEETEEEILDDTDDLMPGAVASP
jgi:hypothetical protein